MSSSWPSSSRAGTSSPPVSDSRSCFGLWTSVSSPRPSHSRPLHACQSFAIILSVISIPELVLEDILQSLRFRAIWAAIRKLPIRCMDLCIIANALVESQSVLRCRLPVIAPLRPIRFPTIATETYAGTPWEIEAFSAGNNPNRIPPPQSGKTRIKCVEACRNAAIKA